jgi:flagellar motor switch protein FliN/FliY
MAEIQNTQGPAMGARTAANTLAVLKSASERNEATAAPLARVEQHPLWPVLAKLPLQLSVSVPVPRFKVRDLLALRTGQTIETAWKTSEDVPLLIGKVQFAWNEFEVVEQSLAIRLTRLA